MSKTVAIVQSSYIPWKGYFDLIRRSDEFILLDDVQYTRRDWRNRNRIKTARGLVWLTIPLKNKGHYHARIEEMETVDDSWRHRHWEQLRQAYRTARYFREEAEFVATLYRQCSFQRLSDINYHFLSALCQRLGITTPLCFSSRYGVKASDANARLIALCQAAGATHYLSGPRARSYLDEERFRAAGITVEYIDYSGYPVYDQPHGAFEHHVSILDLLFCVGSEALHYLESDAK
ncbi:MAG: WbqC family protein [Rhodocyclaceae bacterium]|nr:WbqC family protein [Rhodocyclaceae bacterium]